MASKLEFSNSFMTLGKGLLVPEVLVLPEDVGSQAMCIWSHGVMLLVFLPTKQNTVHRWLRPMFRLHTVPLPPLANPQHSALAGK